MHRKLAAVIALTLTSVAFGASGTKPGAKRPAPPQAREIVLPAGSGDSSADLVGRTVFQVLLGELALQRGDIEMALSAYADLARRTHDPRVLERAAEIATFARQFELAHEMVRQWLQVEPDSQKARQSLTTLLVLLNRIDELAPQISALLEQDKENLPDNLLRLNRMFARHGDRQAVQRLIDQIVAPYRGMAEAHYAMATAAANAGDHVRAQAETRRALELRPDWELAALLQAQLLARESAGDAILGLARFVDKYPGATDARLTLARLLISEKRYDEARAHFNRLLREHPENPDVIYPVAMLALQQNDVATGKAQLEKLLQGDFGDKSTVHFFLGQIEEDQNHPADALDHYRQVVAGEQYVPARARAALILLKQGNLDEARQALRAAPGRTDEEKLQLTVAESHLLREAKQYQEAYQLLEGALAKQPQNTDLLYEAALMAERLGRIDTLEAHLKRLLEIKPDHAHALNALGYSWADRNMHLEQAYDLIKRALALSPDDAFIMDSMGWVLHRQGKDEEALAVLSKAYGLKPDPEIAAHLGEVLWTLNRKDDARKVLSDAAKKDPDNDVLTAALKKYVP